MSRGFTLHLPRRRVGRFGGRPLRAGESARVLPLAAPVAGVALGVLAAAVAAFVAEPPSGGALLGAAGLLAAAAVAEAFPMPIEGVTIGATSLALVFVVATGVLYEWPTAAIVAFLTMVAVELYHRRPPLRVVFNTSMYVCAAAAAAVAASPFVDDNAAALVSAAFVGAVAFYAVDIALLSGVIARAREQSWPSVVRVYMYSTVGPFAIMASLAATLVLLWKHSPFASLVLVGPMLAIAFYQRWLHGAVERVREFDRLKDEFLAVLSHELRTPLTSVYGSAMTLQQQDVDPPTRSSLLSIIGNESARLARLLDDILWASRLDTARVETVIAPTDAEPIAAEVVGAARSRLPAGVEIELALDGEVPPVRADADKLRQVLVNLVENAIKYSPDGGRVRVELRRAGRFAHFSVHDEGIGIPVNEQERIFDKFHRLDPNMTRGIGGTGLGLYICSQLVERMNGRIWVESTEGSGSTFTFELPLD